jgi:hypothetical protein
MEQEIH